MKRLILIFTLLLVSGVAGAAFFPRGVGNSPVNITSVTVTPGTFLGGSADGTSTGAIAVTLSQGTFTGTIAMGSCSQSADFRVSASTLPANLLLNGTQAAGSYTACITPTQAGLGQSGTPFPVTITGTASQTIASITPTSCPFTAGTQNGAVCNLSVTMSPASPASTAALTLTGTNSGAFHLVGTGCANISSGTCTIEQSAAVGGTPASNYTDVNVVATQGFGQLPNDRDASTNWRMAGRLSVGGIPILGTQCGSTITPIGGGSDDSVAINAAIQACPTGQYVNLGSGTFTVIEGNYLLMNKGVVLNGQGPGVTIISRATGTGGWDNTGCTSGAWGATRGCSSPGNNPSPHIIMSPLARFNSNTVTGSALTADGAQGATSITVASATGFSVGQYVVLDELSNAGWMTDIANAGYDIWAATDWRVTYHMHRLHSTGCSTPTATPGASPCNGFSSDDGTNVESDYSINTDRMTNEIKKISAISGNVITFDSPLTISYRTANTAKLWHFTTPFLENAGIQNMTLQNADDASVETDWCASCWSYNVETTNWLNEGYAINQSFRFQLERFYIHDGAWCVPGGGGYNISTRYDTSETLIENGISTRCNKVMVARASGAGEVVAYNYMDDGYIGGNSSWVEAGLNASHLVGPHHALFEGNWGFNAESDETHGNSTHMTFFRNWITGIRSPFIGVDNVNRIDGACSGQVTALRRAISPHVYSYWNSYIGNILGTSGCTTAGNGWTLNGNSQTNPAIFMLGWDDQSTVGNDPTVNTIYPAVGPGCSGLSPNCSTIADGNWDYVQNQITWASNDTAHVLPSSMYLAASPAVFASTGCTWPWVNPIVPTISTLPAKARADAGTPFTDVPCGGSATATITANPTAITAPASSTISWNSTNAALCTGTNFNAGFAASGSEIVQPSVTTTYTATCGAATANATVTVTAANDSKWNPATVNPTFWVLSNNNYTAGISSGNNFTSGLATTSHTSGQLYAEFQCTGIVSSADDGMGIGNASTNLGSGLGGDANSAKFLPDGRFAYNATFTTGVWAGCVTGDTVGIKVDIGAHTMAAATRHSGTWGSFNSAPGTQPISGAVFLAGELVQSGDSLTVCSNTTSCGIGPLPTGYSWWK